MIVSAIEHFLIFSTVFAAAAFALAWIVRRAVRRGRWCPRPYALARLYTMSLLLPPAAAAWLVAASLLPEWWLGEIEFEAAHPSPAHGLHLLGELTAPWEPGLGLGALAFLCATGLLLAVSTVCGHVRARRTIGRLVTNPPLRVSARRPLLERLCSRRRLASVVVPTEYPLCFVVGLRRNAVVLSSGLLDAVTDSELRAVIEHEAAHHRRHDNLHQLVLAGLTYASLAAPLSRTLLRWRREQIELVCDEIAAAYTAAPLDVAQALVAVRRRMLSVVRPSLSLAATMSALVSGDASCFEDRVRRLVALAERPPDPVDVDRMVRASRRQLTAVALLFGLTLAGIAWSAPMAVHRAAEALIHLIS